MSTIVLQDKWDLVNAENADRWLRAQGMPSKESLDLAYKLAGKMSRATLSSLYEHTKASGAGNLIDTAVGWLKLYNVKTFGGVKSHCVTDVTTELPVAGLVANGVDMPKLVPELIKSAVGIQTVKEFGADYLFTTSGLKNITGNGLLNLSDMPTQVVTRDQLVEKGFIIKEDNTPKIISLMLQSNHKSTEVWADRLLRRSRGAGHKITSNDLTLLESENPQVARALKTKLLVANG